MTYLFLYLAVTIVGYLIGAKLKKKDIQLPWVGRVQTAVIVVLVFLMGSRIGANQEIVASLGTIGLVSFIYTILVLAVTTAAFSLVRRLLGFDRYGIRRTDPPEGRRTERSEEDPPDRSAQKPAGSDADKGGSINSLTILIVIFMGIGIASGYLFLPAGFIALTGTLLTLTLCVLLVLIGVDIGTAGTLVRNFRGAGWRILVFPFVSIAAMMIASVIASLFLPMGIQDSLCIGSGFAWYSLAPVMLAEYSTRISAISFMHNVFREVMGILLVPAVARYVGHIECCCLGGSTSMDICLPIVERSTSGDVAVYSFITGATLSASVPILVSIFMSL